MATEVSDLHLLILNWYTGYRILVTRKHVVDKFIWGWLYMP